jgi:hypothetical protein
VPRTRRSAIDDFAKVELERRRLTEAERMPKSQRLLEAEGRCRRSSRALSGGHCGVHEPEALVRDHRHCANLAPQMMGRSRGHGAGGER